MQMNSRTSFASLRNTQPTARGLISPSFLVRAVRLPPKRRGRTDSGHIPASCRLVKSVRRPTNESDDEESFVRSFRCYGFKPSRPPAEPLGKDLIALRISEEVTEKQVGRILLTGRRSS